MAVLEEVTGSVRAVVDRVGPAVVGLGRGWGRGSGVVVAPGRVVTNAHNLRGDDVSVTFADGRVETGEVVGVDSDGDLAVIAVETGDAEPVEIAGDASLATGSVVFALANPGGRGLRATLGLVSTTERSFRGPRGRRFRGAIEHTAPLPRGSSGGPLVDEAGRLLGINTVRLDGGLIVAIAADQGPRRGAPTTASWPGDSAGASGAAAAPGGGTPRARRLARARRGARRTCRASRRREGRPARPGRRSGPAAAR